MNSSLSLIGESSSRAIQEIAFRSPHEFSVFLAALPSSINFDTIRYKLLTDPEYFVPIPELPEDIDWLDYRQICDGELQNKIDCYRTVQSEIDTLYREFERKEGEIEEFIPNEDLLVCIASYLQLPNLDIWHLPMLDFEFHPTPDNFESITTALINTSSVPDGFLINSGNSYHFIGEAMLKGDSGLRKWLHDLGQYESLMQYVDKDWYTLTLKEGIGYLRVAPGLKSKKVQPKIVSLISKR